MKPKVTSVADPQFLLVWSALVVTVLLTAAYWLDVFGTKAAILAVYNARNATIDFIVAALPWPSVLGPVIDPWLRSVVLSPHFFVAAALILFLESRYPVHPGQATWSVAFLHDFLWLFVQLGIFSWMSAWFVGKLAGLYESHLAFLTVPGMDGLSTAATLAVAVVVSDLVAWLHHVVRHKVQWFWWFHTVHHSQTRMNMWTDSRYHVVEYFIADVIRFVPLFALKLQPVHVAALAWLMMWYPRLYHASIRSNFGVLRFVLVTPQSHRIHHSLAAEHQNKNFGVLFSVWDRIFGTQSHDVDFYPATGIVAADFPEETTWTSVVTLKTFAAQMLYPFRLLARQIARRPALGVVLLGLCMLLAGCAACQGAEFQWPGAAKGAVALTYDDGLDAQLDRAIPDLEAANLRGTFFVSATSESFERRKAEWRDAAHRGHELGNHSLVHPCLRNKNGEERTFVDPARDLTNYTVSRMTDELHAMNSLLQSVDGLDRRTFAYPCGDEVAGGKSYVDAIRPMFGAARSTRRDPVDPRTVDPYRVPCWGARTADEMIAHVEEATHSGQLVVFLFHGIGGGHDINVDREEHRKLLAWLDANRNLVWTAPFGTVMQYVKEERQRLGLKGW